MKIIKIGAMLRSFSWVGFTGKGGLNKDPTDWPDGARPANTCIPTFFPGNMPAKAMPYTNPMSMFASI
jgi:hypothetical protein